MVLLCLFVGLLTFSLTNQIQSKDLIIPSSAVVTPVSSEVIVGNTATLTCIISGISKAQTDVIWKKKGSDNLSTVKGYGVDIGTFTDGRQSTTLTLDGSINVADTTYTCDVTPTAGGTAQSTDVRLSVFGTFIKPLQ